MDAMLISWAGTAVVILVLAWLVGARATGRAAGILIDNRYRYSLNHFQLVFWTVVVLSLIVGVFAGRLFSGVPNALDFTIPAQVLGLIGITIGSGLASATVKSTLDAQRSETIATGLPEPEPTGLPGAIRRGYQNPGAGRTPGVDLVKAATNEGRVKATFLQVFLQEEGAFADKVVDIAKFQSFITTLLLGAAFVASNVQAIRDAGSAADFTALPDLSGQFLILLGISQGLYVGGKLPTRAGEPINMPVSYLEPPARP